MTSNVLFLCLVGSCFCADFAERPRNFSISILYHTQLETGGHVVISPFGVWTLMAGAAQGATGNSYKQLAQALILPKKAFTLIAAYRDLNTEVLDPPPSSGVNITCKNFIFLNKNLTASPAFTKDMQSDFLIETKVLDFDDPNSVKNANSYIEKFGGNVSNVFRSGDFQDASMILTNVISFKGLWATSFNESDTLIEPFYNEDNVVIGRVKMMFQKGKFFYANIKNLEASVLELPYGRGGKYSMILFLPYANLTIGDVYLNFASVTLNNIFNRLKTEKAKNGLNVVNVKIPRFRISTNLILNKPLNRMGVYDIFQPDMAKFERITKQNIYVSAIVQKAVIEVTESGRIAPRLVTTDATISDKISTPSFHCNRPFIYFVMEKYTTTVIFSGIYAQPTVF